MLQKLIDNEEERNLQKVKNYIAICEEKFPKVAIVKTNPNDEPSERYTRIKKAKMEDNKINACICIAESNDELIKIVNELNQDDTITGIIIQAPFGPGITMKAQDVFDLVNPKKDIDRLHSKWYYDRDENNLPLTALGMYKILKNFEKEEKMNLLFYGNGLTTNKRLFLKMFDEGKLDCRIANSKTPEYSVDELVEWSDIIVASTGIPEVLECSGKYIISPTIAKTENGMRSDLKHNCRECNKVHNILGGIGKLTTSELLVRAYEDILK